MPVAGCCTVGDAEDARRVAAQLDVPYYVLDYVDEFRDGVVDRFGAAYLAGATPNPCIECNRTVRFRALLERTAALGLRRAGDRSSRQGSDGSATGITS